MISKGTHKPLSGTSEKGCVDWCFIPSWTRGALSFGYYRSKRDDDSVSRKRQKLMESSSHHNNKLERLLFEEMWQCDVCAKNLVHRSTVCEEVSVADALPKFIERHNIKCQTFPCRWCDNASGNNSKHPCCDALFCSEECRTRAECALYDDQSQCRDTSVKALMPSSKLFFCRNRFQAKNSNVNNDSADDLIEEAVQSLAAIETKLRVLCGNNLGLEECALLLTTILSVVSPLWMDRFLQSFCGDAYQDGSAYEESLTEELCTLARSHWSIFMLLQSSERCDDASTRQFITYEKFWQTYLCIKRQYIRRVRLPDHPLIQYSKKTLLSADALSEKERDLALDILKHPCLPISRHHAQSKKGSTDQQSIARWRNAAHTAHWLANAASLEEGKGVSQIQTHLGRTYFVFSPWAFRKMQHSCCPVAMLDVQDPSSPLESLSWLTLHDLEEGHLNSYSVLGDLKGDTKSRALELKKLFGPDFTCTCTRCLYENDYRGNDRDLLPYNRLQLNHLADLAMQHGRLTEAIGLYESILESHPCDGNVLHARAAAVLGNASISFGDKGHCNGHFLRAQHLWKEAGSKCIDHSEIDLHVDKQRVYGTVTVDSVPHENIAK